MSGYELSRAWFDFAFENPEKVRPIHAAIYFFAVEHCNRLGGKEKFGFPSQMTMDAIGVRKYQTYGEALSDLEDWGFITFVERSKNQYSANIISINAVPKNGKARGKALDKATIKHGAKQGQSTGQRMDSIDKPLTIEPLTINQEALPPSPVKLSDRIPDIETFVSFGLEKASANRLNVTETALRMKYEAWKAAGWVNGNGQEVKNWKASLLNTLRHIVETEKGKPKEFETQPEREAREFMEQLKKDTTNLILYGDVQPNNHDQQPTNDSRVQRLSGGSTGHEAD